MKKNSNSYFYIATTIIIAIYFISFYSKITEGFIISKNVYVFYHIYCNKNTIDIIKDQCTKIVFSGLYDAVKQVYCFLAGEKNYIDIVAGYIATLPNKFKI